MPTKSKATESYRQLNDRLDEIMATLQDPDLDIDEATAAYEEGLRLVTKLEKHLQQAENNVQAIRAKFGEIAAED